MISFDELARRKPDRNFRPFRMILDQPHRGVNRSVHSAVVIIFVTKIRPPRHFVITGDMNRMSNQFLNSLTLNCGNRNYRDLQNLFHLINPDRPSVPPHLIHHIQRQHNRYAQFQHLHGQIQIPLYVRRVDDVDDRRRLFLENILAGNDFLARVGRQRIYPRKIHNLCFRMPLDAAALTVHCNARKVPHMLVRSGELVE